MKQSSSIIRNSSEVDEDSSVLRNSSEVDEDETAASYEESIVEEVDEGYILRTYFFTFFEIIQAPQLLKYAYTNFNYS